jgi:hypothetical protein
MLYSVTAVSDSDVWAVGTYGDYAGFFHPLIEHWNGSHWSAEGIKGLSSAAEGILTAVTSAHNQVFATGQLSSNGSDKQVVLQLVRGSWVMVHESAVHNGKGAAADAYPQSIANSRDGLWVAGRYRSGHFGYSTYVDAPGPGSRLVQQDTLNPTAEDNFIWGIAPVDGGRFAWAVGDSLPPSSGNANSLIEYGSATSGWHIISSPNPGSAHGNTILDGVFAVSSSNVWAVGTYDGAGGMKTLIMHYTAPRS